MLLMKHKSKLDEFIAQNYADVSTVKIDSNNTEETKPDKESEKKKPETDESDKLWNALGTMAQMNQTTQHIKPSSDEEEK
jgi:DNA topoisomerase VI subunit B